MQCKAVKLRPLCIPSFGFTPCGSACFPSYPLLLDAHRCVYHLRDTSTSTGLPAHLLVCMSPHPYTDHILDQAWVSICWLRRSSRLTNESTLNCLLHHSSHLLLPALFPARKVKSCKSLLLFRAQTAHALTPPCSSLSEFAGGIAQHFAWTLLPAK